MRIPMPKDAEPIARYIEKTVPRPDTLPKLWDIWVPNGQDPKATIGWRGEVRRSDSEAACPLGLLPSAEYSRPATPRGAGFDLFGCDLDPVLPSPICSNCNNDSHVDYCPGCECDPACCEDYGSPLLEAFDAFVAWWDAQREADALEAMDAIWRNDPA